MVFDDLPPSLFGFHGTVGQTSCEWSGGKSGNERLPDEAADKNQRFSPKAALWKQPSAPLTTRLDRFRVCGSAPARLATDSGLSPHTATRPFKLYFKIVVFVFKISKNSRPIIPVWALWPPSHPDALAGQLTGWSWQFPKLGWSSEGTELFFFFLLQLQNCQLMWRCTLARPPRCLILKLFLKPTSFPWLLTPRGLLILCA